MLTRPLGASVADWLGKPTSDGGVGLGAGAGDRAARRDDRRDRRVSAAAGADAPPASTRHAVRARRSTSASIRAHRGRRRRAQTADHRDSRGRACRRTITQLSVVAVGVRNPRLAQVDSDRRRRTAIHGVSRAGCARAVRCAVWSNDDARAGVPQGRPQSRARRRRSSPRTAEPRQLTARRATTRNAATTSSPHAAGADAGTAPGATGCEAGSAARCHRPRGMPAPCSWKRISSSFS